MAKGYSQIYGIDYDKTFSPVARFDSIRFLLAHAALKDWEIKAMDVKTAFLNGKLSEEIYMEQPEGFVIKGKKNQVARLRRAIYGLKQASRRWYELFNSTLEQHSFHRIHSDGGIYVCPRTNTQDIIILILYVDNLLLMGPNMNEISQVKKQLGERFQMKDLGPAELYLGI